MDEAHAQNPFSVNVEAKIVSFFQTAFQGVLPTDMTLANMTPGNQTWWLKEVGNCIALIGFFLFFVPFISLLTKARFFKGAVTEETAPIPLPDTRKGKTIFWVSSLVLGVLPAVLYIPLTQLIAPDIRIIEMIAIAFAVIMLIVGFLCKAKASGDSAGKYEDYAKGGFLSAAVSAVMAALLFGNKIFALNPWFNQTTTNWTSYWALIIGFILAIVTIAMYYFVNKPNGIKIEAYGLRIKPKSVFAAFATAAAAFAAGYLILFMINGIFSVDFRIWTFAVKVFRVENFLTMLKYLPLYFVFYLMLSLSLNANSRSLKHGYWYSILITSAGLVLWMVIQYGSFYIKGVAAWPTQGMIAIGLLATIPGMILATVFTKKIYEKTNNIWTSAFFNSLLFTMIPVANTLLYWNLVNA